MGTSLFRFDAFELDPANFQLRHSGRPVQIQKIPLDLLLLLVERRGQLVTRDEIVEKIWGKDVFVDADSAVSTAIRKIRRALGDNPAEPKFIETIPGKGYRFISTILNPPADDAIRDVEKDPVADGPTIAVLPLDDLTDDSQDYFSEGMTEEILTQLGRLHPSLGVIARTSVMRYKGTRKSMREIGCELGVAYALEGSVRRHAGRVRLSVQLIETQKQTHLWAESYERPLDDILKLQSQLAREIAGQISAQLRTEAPELTIPAVRVGADAYEAYLKGRYFWHRRSEQAMIEGIERFEEAIKLEPSFAAAYAGLADAYAFFGIHGIRLPDETYPKAEQAARKALALDSTLPEAHNALAHIQVLFYWNWPAAEPLFKRAIQLNPSYADARFFYGGVLAELGQYKEAIRQIERARELDPVSVITQAFLGYVCYRARQYQRAEVEIRRAIEFNPHFPVSRWFLGLVLQEQGDLEGAIQTLQVGVKLSMERPLYLAALGHAYGRAQRREEALGVLDKLLASSELRYVSPFDIALVHLGLGDKDAAFEWLEKAYGQRVARMRSLRDAFFDVLRSDSRYIDLMHRVGLPIANVV